MTLWTNDTLIAFWPNDTSPAGGRKCLDSILHIFHLVEKRKKRIYDTFFLQSIVVNHPVHF